MKEIFLKICELLGEKYPKMPVEVFANQFDKSLREHNNELPLALPAVLVEFSNTEWKNEKGRQLGDTIITIHIGQDLYTEYSSKKEDAFKVLDLVQVIYLAIQNQTTPISTPFTRKTTKYDKEEKNLCVYQMDFSTQIFDDSISNNDSLLFVTPDIIVTKD